MSEINCVKTELSKQDKLKYNAMVMITYIDNIESEDGKHINYIPIESDGYFPILLDYSIRQGEPCPIPEFAPAFKFTHNVFWRPTDNKPLLTKPEPFPDDEFDIRQYFQAYAHTIWLLYGDNVYIPTSRDIDTYCSNLSSYICMNRDIKPEEIDTLSEHKNMFHTRFPNNFITKYVMSQPVPNEHPLYYQFVNCQMVKPDGTKLYCAYLAHTNMITPDKMDLLKTLAYSGPKDSDGNPTINPEYYVGSDILSCYDSVLKFMPYTKNEVIHWPLLRF
jgi:hypothetical protein